MMDAAGEKGQKDRKVQSDLEVIFLLAGMTF